MRTALGAPLLVLWLVPVLVHSIKVQSIVPSPVILDGPVTFTFTEEPGDPQEVNVVAVQIASPNEQIGPTSLPGSSRPYTILVPNEKSFIGGWILHIRAVGSTEDLTNVTFNIVDTISVPPTDPRVPVIPPTSQSGSPQHALSSMSDPGQTLTTAPGGATLQPNGTSTLSTAAQATTGGAQSYKPHLDTRTVAGIAIGSVLFILICSILASLLWLKRRRKRLITTYTGDSESTMESSINQHFSIEPYIESIKASLQDRDAKRMDYGSFTDSKAPPFKMSGTWSDIRQKSLPDLPSGASATASIGDQPVDSPNRLSLFISDRQGRILPIEESDRVFLEFGVVVGKSPRVNSNRRPPSYTSG